MASREAQQVGNARDPFLLLSLSLSLSPFVLLGCRLWSRSEEDSEHANKYLVVTLQTLSLIREEERNEESRSQAEIDHQLYFLP